ncbi:MAG: hypothetical protein H0U74_22260 [Bradymonadaceae bacterium]|nr:hypothetical protein [Lujinxingiaceae bacterium]
MRSAWVLILCFLVSIIGAGCDSGGLVDGKDTRQVDASNGFDDVTTIDADRGLSDTVDKADDVAAPDATDTDARDAHSGDDADAATDAAPDTVVDEPGWAHADGRWSAPENTLLLPAPLAGGGLYIDDVQARYPDVNWQTLDRLYIAAGDYKLLLIGNLPVRSADRPLIITNHGGQVRVGNMDHYYLMSLNGGANWVLTGRYDALAQTGHPDFAGHKSGDFANTQDTYGILIDDAQYMHERGNNGLRIAGGATDFEVEFLEIRHVGFAGMNIKTDNNGQAHMANVKLHDNYIHDVLSEGFYIGSTQSQPQHQIQGFEIYNNRVLRVGTEAFQIGHVGSTTTRVYNNVFGPSAIDWRAAFQNYQDGNLQMSIRSGRLEVFNNVFIGGAGKWAEFFGALVASEERKPGDGIFLENNYFSQVRNFGIYIHATDMSPLVYHIGNNRFRGYDFTYNELHPNTQPGELIRIANSTMAITLVDNTWEAPAAFSNRLADGNGTNANVSGSGNVRAAIAPVSFRNAGLAADFDYMTMEMWTATATRATGAPPVEYQLDDIVIYRDNAYRCQLDPCPAGRRPVDHADVWQRLAPFPDDVRLHPDSAHQGLGLMPNP